MLRTFTYNALILRTRASGESNRDAWFLSAEEGILKATVFGGPKSKLRAHVAPFHSGRIWIYHDPVKDSRKLTDFDVKSWRPGLRESYERTMTAGAVAETILASHGGGNWGPALKLGDSVFDALENADDENCGRILIYFFWHWADILGSRPELNRCVSCGKEAAPADALLFSPLDGGMLCPRCAGNADFAESRGLLSINPGCRRWLEVSENLSPALLNRYSMDEKSNREAKALTRAILTEALGKRLATWDW
jgi:DNA repair protein RecO (recombination protein O)